jgi:hypothetical protein
MDINDTWKNMSNEDPEMDKIIQSPVLSTLHSTNTLAKLKKSVGANIIWGILVCIFYLLIIINFQIWQVQIGLGIVLVFSFWAIADTYRLYKQIDPVIAAENSLLQEMQKQYSNINQWMHTQKRVALFFYPIAAASGFMLGGVLGSGKSLNFFMSKPITIIALIVTVIVLVPAANYMAKWMFEKSFGKQLKRLKENIDALNNQ